MLLYPYQLFKLIKTEPQTDEYGFISEESHSEWVYHSDCRNYPVGSGNKHETESFEIIKKSSVIVLPKDTKILSEGTKIKVIDKEEVRLEARVLRFERNRLHCRIWV